MSQGQVLQDDFARHRVHIEQLPRQRFRLVGVGQGQQLFGQAAGAAQLVDDGAQAFARTRGIALAQRVLRLRQHDGQWCAQLMRGVGQKMGLLIQHPSIASNVMIDGIDQRRHLAGYARGVQRRQVIGTAVADIGAQAAQGLERPGNAPPHQQHHQCQHAGVAQDLLPPSAVFGFDPFARAFGDHNQHLAMQALVVKIAHHGHDPHRVIAVDAVVEDGLPIRTRPSRRARHLRHAQKGLALLFRYRRFVRDGRVNLFDAEVLAQAGAGFQHDLRVQGRCHLQIAVGRELQAAFKHAGGLHQRAVIGFVGDLGQSAVVVQAVDDQQHHHAGQQQDDKQRADADARQSGDPQAHSASVDSLATLSSM
ncbi:hypothetical protein D3C72_1107310 [compost metagenome]